MTERAPLDLWPVHCSRCQKRIGATNGNGDLPIIYCIACELPALKEADEFLDQMDTLARGDGTSMGEAKP